MRQELDVFLAQAVYKQKYCLRCVFNDVAFLVRVSKVKYVLMGSGVLDDLRNIDEYDEGGFRREYGQWSK